MQQFEENRITDPTIRQRYHAGRKRFILIGLLIYSAALGVIDVMSSDPDDPAFNVILSLPVIVLIFQWCCEDARQRDFQLSKLMRISLILLGAVAIPIYAFRTRGLRGFMLIATGAAFFAMMLAASFVAAFAVEFLRG